MPFIPLMVRWQGHIFLDSSSIPLGKVIILFGLGSRHLATPREITQIGYSKCEHASRVVHLLCWTEHVLSIYCILVILLYRNELVSDTEKQNQTKPNQKNQAPNE